MSGPTILRTTLVFPPHSFGNAPLFWQRPTLLLPAQTQPAPGFGLAGPDEPLLVPPRENQSKVAVAGVKLQEFPGRTESLQVQKQ